MEKIGKVNNRVIEDIEGAKEQIIEKTQNITSKLVAVKKFKIYFAIRTQIDILNKMKERIMKSKENNDNPKVAEDSIKILDSMQQFTNLTASKLDEIDFTDFLELQKNAKRMNLFPETSGLKETFNPSEIEHANRFFDNIRNKIAK